MVSMITPLGPVASHPAVYNPAEIAILISLQHTYVATSCSCLDLVLELLCTSVKKKISSMSIGRAKYIRTNTILLMYYIELLEWIELRFTNASTGPYLVQRVHFRLEQHLSLHRKEGWPPPAQTCTR